MPPTMTLRRLAIVILALWGNAIRAGAESDLAPLDVIVSVPDQKMMVLRAGGWLKKYKVSTSRFGLGDNYGSYKTPVGRMRVWEKLGGELPSGAVIKHREATGEILPVNAPGRDPIVSRILWLEGLESQNDNARGRGIYIHGTTEESNIGKPVSWGCIRMRSDDVIDLYDIVSVGATVTITSESLPRFPKWKPAPPVLMASQIPPPPSAKPLPRQSRAFPERLPVVAELLRPADNRIVPADAGAANAFRGSILFAGLSDVPKAAPKAPPKSAPESLRAAEVFTLAAVPLAGDVFSLRVATAIPPLRLIDLRRAAVSSWLALGSIFEAPPPAPSLVGAREELRADGRGQRLALLNAAQADPSDGFQPISHPPQRPPKPPVSPSARLNR